MRAAEEPFPGDPRRGEGNSGEDRRDFRLQVPAVPAQRDAVGPGQGLPGMRAHRDESMQTVRKTQRRTHTYWLVQAHVSFLYFVIFYINGCHE